MPKITWSNHKSFGTWWDPPPPYGKTSQKIPYFFLRGSLSMCVCQLPGSVWPHKGWFLKSGAMIDFKAQFQTQESEKDDRTFPSFPCIAFPCLLRIAASQAARHVLICCSTDSPLLNFYKPPSQWKRSVWLVAEMNSLAGQQVLRRDESVVAADSALEGKKIIAFYFSAHWCPPCRLFTPVLAEFYSVSGKRIIKN